MCGPAALALSAAAITAVGTGVGAIQASAQQRYQARIADSNAKLAAESGHQQDMATKQDLQAHWRQVSQLEGQQRTALAAGGVDLGFGSAADIQGDTQLLAREDAKRVIDRGANAVRGFDIESANYGAQAKASRQAASGAIVKGIFGVASTALGGASQYAQLKKQYGS